jgi:poly(3-hydroxybutyrate) depolymerase
MIAITALMLSVLSPNLLACPSKNKTVLPCHHLNNGQKNSANKVVGRDYYLHVPKILSNNAPLVFAFHGSGGDKASAMIKYSGLVKLGSKEKFITVFPQGLPDHQNKPHWSDGRETFKWHYDHVDDIAFVKEIMQDLKQKNIQYDQQRVYGIGISNGGVFALYSACKAPNLFKAIGTVVATMSKEMLVQECASKSLPAKPVMMIFGDQDKTMPYKTEGEMGRAGSHSSAAIGIPIFASLSFWSKNNRCHEKTAAQWLKNSQNAVVIDQVKKVPRTWRRKEQTSYVEIQSSGCKYPVRYLEARMAGHRWHKKNHPKGITDFTKKFRVSREFDSQQKLWDFISQF